MRALRLICALYALLLALVVAVNYVVTPLYDDGSTGYPVWSILNWFMAAGAGLALVAGTVWKVRYSNTEDVKEYFRASGLFYASVVLFLWFFSNWFADMMSREVPLLWELCDPLFVVVLGATGLRLLSESCNQADASDHV